MKSLVKAAGEAIVKSLENNDSKNVTLQKREKIGKENRNKVRFIIRRT